MKRMSGKPILWLGAVFALALVVALPLAALADQVVNNLDNTVDATLETATITAGGPGVSVGYYIKTEQNIPQGDLNGCNATGNQPATVTLSVPPNVTASSTSLVFTECGATENVKFSSSKPGSYNISVASVTGGKPGSLWETAPAAFTLVVNAAPPSDTTPPVITPSIVGTLGNNGWYTSDVTVSWTVTDDESTITSTSGCGTTTINADTAGTTLTCSATSAGGTSSESVTIKRDATAPSITASVSPDVRPGWTNQDVTVSFTCSDGGSGVASCTEPQILSGEGANQSVTGTAVDLAGNSATATVSDINIDLTAPTISGAASPDANAAGWNNTDVTVSFTCDDALSGVASCTSPVMLGEGANQSVTGTAVDLAGNSATATVSDINIDLTAPVVKVTGVTDGATYTLGSVPSAGCSTTDALSGVATEATLSSLGGPVGSITVTCSGALDKAGNPGAAASATYNVIYNWNGFFRPVDNPPVVNAVKAGSAVPVKFSLNGNQGLNIFAAGYPKSIVTNCTTGAPTDTIDETLTAGNSSLSYDAAADQYVYVWKTDKGWAGQCRQLVVKLVDNTEHTANFKFTK
jgi:hypothetical protein